MKTVITSIIAILICSSNLLAQFEDSQTSGSAKQSSKPAAPTRTSLKDKLIVGGGLDLQFGNVTIVGVTPLVAYSITDDFLAGGIFTYRFFQDNRPGANYSTSTYGIAPFARYFVYEGFFVHAEYEMLFGEFAYQRDPVWINSFLVGAGYGQRIGDRGFVGIYVLWNLTEDPTYKIYNNPIFRLSFGVGLN